MKKTAIVAIAAALLIAVTALCFAGCTEEWNDGSYDLSLPEPEKITATSGVDEDGWYLVFEDEFEGNSEGSDLEDALNASTVFGEVYKQKNPEDFEGRAKRASGRPRPRA